MKYLTRTIWLLSLVSLFTDTASEMLYPIMPVYLQTIGFSVVLIGILEGLAEAVAGMSKGYFGNLSDNIGKRVPFVQVGYSLSALSKPMMAVFTFPIWIFLARTFDRFGKGIRTGARDALLSSETNAANKGKVFGFHRSMDTVGAVIGPSLALLYLYFFPQDYTTLFYIAFIPGLFAVFSSLLLNESQIKEKKAGSSLSFFSFLGYWNSAPAAYRRLITGLLFFALFNSSDVFLLLQAKQAGLSDTAVIGIYIFYNLIYAIFSFPMGIVADKVGLKAIFILGLALFATVYTGMAFSGDLYLFLFLFFLYGIFAASTEGISKAWITNIAERKDTATAIGMFSALQSLCALFASSVTGLIWFKFGAAASFLLTASVTFLVILYFLSVPKPHTGG